jgi:hypothetical protein
MNNTMRIDEGKLKGILRESISVNDVHNFNYIIDSQNNVLNENNINRMLQWLKDCDCAFITAFRKELKDVRDMNATYLGPDEKNKWKIGRF